MRPPPEPMPVPRVVTPAGAVHSVVLDDLSPQYVTAHEPAESTEAVGLVCSVTALESLPLPTFAIGSEVFVPA